MKLGTFLTILILALVCLGFLINDSIYTHSELATVYQAVETLQNENSQLSQQVAQQAKEIQTLQTQYSTLEDQNKVLSERNIELELQNQTLSADLSNSQAENETLRQISAQLASDTNSSFVKAALVLASIDSLPTEKTILAAGFLPIFLIGSGMLSYGLYSYIRKKTRPNTYVISVSKQELDAIIRHRRAK
jgi:small-conductance mechanosensitive channel